MVRVVLRGYQQVTKILVLQLLRLSKEAQVAPAMEVMRPVAVAQGVEVERVMQHRLS